MNVHRNRNVRHSPHETKYRIAFMILNEYEDHVQIKLISNKVLTFNTIPTGDDIQELECIIAEHHECKTRDIAIIGWNEVR